MDSPTWWATKDYTWERVREALRRDWSQTRHNQNGGGHELNQSLADTVAQGLGQEPMPPIDEANPPRVLLRWEEAEVAIGYGYAARTYFGDEHPQWTDALERRLRKDWKSEIPWSRIRLFVRHGYDIEQ